MKINIKHRKLFIERFGELYGINLYNHFKTDQLDEIQLPNIKAHILLRSDTSDMEAFFQVFIEDQYKISYKKNPQVVIDAGANIGLFTVLIKNQFPDAMVICIEPDKENFEILQKNVAGYNQVFSEYSGLWNKSAHLKVHDKYNRGKWAMIVEETKIASDIKAISIDDLMDKYNIERIDILKIDIETSEKRVFRDNYKNWLPKTKMIIIELHDWMEEGCSKPFFTAINKTFNKYQYQIIGENTIIINEDID